MKFLVCCVVFAHLSTMSERPRRDIPNKNYREVAGYRARKAQKNPAQEEFLKLAVNSEEERELFSDQAEVSEDLDFMDDVGEELSTEEILALAREEEDRCGALEEREKTSGRGGSPCRKGKTSPGESSSRSYGEAQGG